MNKLDLALNNLQWLICVGLDGGEGLIRYQLSTNIHKLACQQQK